MIGGSFQCYQSDAVVVCGSRFFSVHRLVLMACSNYFCDIFSHVRDCPKPVIVLQDIATHDFEALLDYMYLGEVDVHQNRLPGLIKAAEYLHIKGLATSDDDPTMPLKTLDSTTSSAALDEASNAKLESDNSFSKTENNSFQSDNNKEHEDEKSTRRHRKRLRQADYVSTSDYYDEYNNCDHLLENHSKVMRTDNSAADACIATPLQDPVTFSALDTSLECSIKLEENIDCQLVVTSGDVKQEACAFGGGDGSPIVLGETGPQLHYHHVPHQQHFCQDQTLVTNFLIYFAKLILLLVYSFGTLVY